VEGLPVFQTTEHENIDFSCKIEGFDYYRARKVAYQFVITVPSENRIEQDLPGFWDSLSSIEVKHT